MTGKKITFYKANLCDRESLKVPFQKVRYIVMFLVKQCYNRMLKARISFYKILYFRRLYNLSIPTLQHQIDGVVHLAALKAVGESCREPLMYYANNVTGSANLFQVRILTSSVNSIKHNRRLTQFQF